MTELPHDGDLERLVQQYLHELGRDLGRLPASQRDRLVGEIRDHITELRAERPPRDASDMEALLNRVGLPEDIAAVALEDIDDLDTTDSVQSEAGTSGVRGRVRRFRLLVGAAGAAILLVLVVLVGVNATHHSDVPGSGGTHSTTAPTTRSGDSPPSRVTVPNVIGVSVAQAEVELQSADFTVKVVPNPSNTVPGGSVVAQGPAAGSFMPGGSTVTVDVSTGPAS